MKILFYKIASLKYYRCAVRAKKGCNGIWKISSIKKNEPI